MVVALDDNLCRPLWRRRLLPLFHRHFRYLALTQCAIRFVENRLKVISVSLSVDRYLRAIEVDLCAMPLFADRSLPGDHRAFRRHLFEMPRRVTEIEERLQPRFVHS